MARKSRKKNLNVLMKNAPQFLNTLSQILVWVNSSMDKSKQAQSECEDIAAICRPLSEDVYWDDYDECEEAYLWARDIADDMAKINKQLEYAEVALSDFECLLKELGDSKNDILC